MPIRRMLWMFVIACGIGFGTLQACGGDRAAPNLADLVIAKTETESGDEQVGVAGTMLAKDLRVVVTRDEEPVPHMPVIWFTPEGSVVPATDTTDANGVSSARWRLEEIFAQQVAFARVDPDGPPAVSFTAIATPDPAARNTVLVRNDGENRFDPPELAIFAGDTVSWFWSEGSAGHNVVPDDGDTPPQSGPLVDYPKYHSFRFEIPGVYHYHCMAHGGAGGAGMSGTITVLSRSDLF